LADEHHQTPVQTAQFVKASAIGAAQPAYDGSPATAATYAQALATAESAYAATVAVDVIALP
jgi:hypothetical protein